MSYKSPTPQTVLPADIVDTLNGYSTGQLQDVARYGEELRVCIRLNVLIY
ncbi:hypothetical protein [Halostagnicola kamekurae]|uniref:Uncharacterized protein n=1 Tax=Halostagnicola kamekurae TaxID=619731 RepID=A0A1I6UWA4_9EURY|nr:hypothetical protein [Halostagnicola kamekurae]SFT05705.1 hypothetical protein SAMN04488556_4144 [Halostagnicola kamekurae]